MLSAMLAGKGFDGFEETENEIKAYTQEENFSQAAVEEILNNFQIEYSLQLIPAQNWNAVWQSNFHTIAVDDFVAVRADFHEPSANTRHEIIITPKMSFGTGHHATTYMMMHQMRNIDFSNKTVFDFGTGTGILAILAEKLRAASVSAIDNDEWSINNAQENILKNNCTKIDLLLSGSPLKKEKFDIILANINKNIILENLSLLKNSVKLNGILLLSGLLTDDEEVILEKASSIGFHHISTIGRDKWICINLSN